MTTQQSADDQLALGEIIRRQRELAELSMRQVAAMAGISNPYLSQIERGLRARDRDAQGVAADDVALARLESTDAALGRVVVDPDADDDPQR